MYICGKWEWIEFWSKLCAFGFACLNIYIYISFVSHSIPHIQLVLLLKSINTHIQRSPSFSHLPSTDCHSHIHIHSIFRFYFIIFNRSFIYPNKISFIFFYLIVFFYYKYKIPDIIFKFSFYHPLWYHINWMQ